MTTTAPGSVALHALAENNPAAASPDDRRHAGGNACCGRRLIQQLMAGAKDGGMKLAGEGGLLQQLTTRDLRQPLPVMPRPPGQPRARIGPGRDRAFWVSWGCGGVGIGMRCEGVLLLDLFGGAVQLGQDGSHGSSCGAFGSV
jgi:hypothetical protein